MVRRSALVAPARQLELSVDYPGVLHTAKCRLPRRLCPTGQGHSLPRGSVHHSRSRLPAGRAKGDPSREAGRS